MANKKIKNASPLEYNGIQFKSKFEKTIYVTLEEEGFPVQYEPSKIVIWEGFKPTIPYYSKSKSGFKMQMSKLKDITYTPDFMFSYNGYLIVIEAKGFVNDTFPIKRKLFRKWLEGHPYSMYFEVYTKTQLLQVISLIKQLKDHVSNR